MSKMLYLVPLACLHMPRIICSTTVNTNKDELFVLFLSEFLQNLVHQGLGLLLENKMMSEVANNVLEQEEVVGVESWIFKVWLLSIFPWKLLPILMNLLYLYLSMLDRNSSLGNQAPWGVCEATLSQLKLN